MEKVFVVGDIHGEAKMLRDLLANWKADQEQLILLGDLADRGPNGKEAIELAYDLANKHNAIIVKGNHEEMLENCLKDPEKNHLHYYLNGGEKTLASLLVDQLAVKEPRKNAEKVKMAYPWLLSFLESLPYFYEWHNYLFVHAGVDLSLKDWRDTTKHDYLWIREGFYDRKNNTSKMIVFGHTVTSTLHKEPSNFDVWQSGDGLIGIDGGAVYGGKLHALVLLKEGIQRKISIAKEQN